MDFSLKGDGRKSCHDKPDFKTKSEKIPPQTLGSQEDEDREGVEKTTNNIHEDHGRAVHCQGDRSPPEIKNVLSQREIWSSEGPSYRSHRESDLQRTRGTKQGGYAKREQVSRQVQEYTKYTFQDHDEGISGLSFYSKKDVQRKMCFLGLESLQTNLGVEKLGTQANQKVEIGEEALYSGGPTCSGGQKSRSCKRRQGRPDVLVTCNAARERTRSEKVKTLRSAFSDLQQALPCVPPDTKLSKLDVLVLASMYIAHLMNTLQNDGNLPNAPTPNDGITPSSGLPLSEGKRVSASHPEYMHPVKKWPMRTRLYTGLAAWARGAPHSVVTSQKASHQPPATNKTDKNYTYL